MKYSIPSSTSLTSSSQVFASGWRAIHRNLNSFHQRSIGAESLYIGTATFIDGQDNFLIYDWRAPVSSIYYNGTLGPVTYETPNG
ncbi:hypothetical protein ACQ5RL_10190, partial [Latilactobacillus curvatus]